MITYADAIAKLSAVDAQKFPGSNVPPGVVGRYLEITLRPGSGTTTEGLFDLTSLEIRSVGEQGSYEDAEALAWEADRNVRQDGSGMFGTRYALRSFRSAGGPAAVTRDTSERTHFTCLYTVESEAEVVNS